jgi:UDP-N-acetylglucosamine/UDP-N-acetylgalactosamine diphosphorylase
VDSPETCRQDQLRQYARWLRAAGVTVPADATGLPAFPFEVSPRFGDDEASFAASWAARGPQALLAAGDCLD